MSTKRLPLTGDLTCDVWAEAVNGLINIARYQIELGNIEKAKRIASDVGEIFDKAYKDWKRHWEICSSIAPTFILFAWCK